MNFGITQGRLYLGKVINCEDEKSCSRVQVRLDKITDKTSETAKGEDYIKDEDLPWYAVLPSASGGNNQAISVPQPGTLVLVSFPDSDIYNGVVQFVVVEAAANK